MCLYRGGVQVGGVESERVFYERDGVWTAWRVDTVCGGLGVPADCQGNECQCAFKWGMKVCSMTKKGRG